MTEIHQLLIPLRIVLAEALQEQEGLRVDSVHIEKVINRPFSDVAFLRAITSGGERKLVLKKTVHHPANISITKRQNQAVVEYEILSKLYPLFQSVPHCHVPRPILVMPEHEAYIMDFVEGLLLLDYFSAAKYFASRNSFDELSEYYYLCGVWLKKLHEFTGVRNAGIEAFSNTIERCEHKLKLIEEANDPRFPKNLTSIVRHLLDEHLNLVRNEDILVTGRHGDFGSWNIIASPNGVTVIDFLGYQEDLLPIDLFKMLMNFEDEKKYLFFSKNRIEAVKREFLRGYGDVPQISRPVATICEALHRVCSLSAGITSTPYKLWHRIERRLSVKANLDWFMNHDNLLLWEISR